jgi:hypothetical protein
VITNLPGAGKLLAALPTALAAHVSTEAVRAWPREEKVFQTNITLAICVTPRFCVSAFGSWPVFPHGLRFWFDFLRDLSAADASGFRRDAAVPAEHSPKSSSEWPGTRAGLPRDTEEDVCRGLEQVFPVLLALLLAGHVSSCRRTPLRISRASLWSLKISEAVEIATRICILFPLPNWVSSWKTNCHIRARPSHRSSNAW